MKIVGYCDPWNTRPGDTVRFMVSTRAAEYRADFVRLIHGDTNPRGPGFKVEQIPTEVDGTYSGRHQPIHVGSYAWTPHDTRLICPDGFTMAAWLFPTTSGEGEQGILTKWSERDRAGYGLHLDDRGCLSLMIGDGSGHSTTVTTEVPTRPGEWYFVAASYDATSGEARLYQVPLQRWVGDRSNTESSVILQPGLGGGTETPLVIAASCGAASDPHGHTTSHYNGKIESPLIYDRTLSPDEIGKLRTDGRSDAGGGLVAAWDFSVDQSSQVAIDRSPNGLHMRIVNAPARAMTGHIWTGDVMDYKAAPDQYGAIHFHDDDLDDARWGVDFMLTVPEDMTSGIYAARLEADGFTDYVPFFVRPTRGGVTADTLFLASTNSYLAYGNEATLRRTDYRRRFPGQDFPYPAQPEDEYILANQLRSLYDYHNDGSGVRYASRLRPIVNVRPSYVWPLYIIAEMPGPHGFAADLHLTDWMAEKGFGFDVATDENLHFDGAAVLEPYRVVVTGSHPEYWSKQMLNYLEAYLAGGGRVMYLGGNGFYWVTSFDPERPHLIEVRRWGGTGSWKAEPGEYYHSTTGELGGLWRNRNRPPQRMLGVGFTAQGTDVNAPYKRTPDSSDTSAAFIFEGIGDDELIGDFESLVFDYGAAGTELDRADPSLGTPPHALVVASSFGHSDGYQHVMEEVFQSNPGEGGTKSELVRADMVYFEGPEGGAVFSVGSISWCGSLSYNSYDNNVSRITENVLRKFASDSNPSDWQSEPLDG